MTLINLQYIPIILLVAAIFIYFYNVSNKKYVKWVSDHWFYRETKYSKLAKFLYITGIVLFLIALLDFRGPEVHIKAKSSNQKTILLIDTSASMNSQDVRPSRIKKAILMAKHFVKLAYGQEISVIVFSDSTKRIVPFTKDNDLLDARLSSLENLNNNRGGSNLSLAINESIQYFITNGENTMGNILIFTDGEETVSFDKLKIPDTVSVAAIGIGTLRGGTIPIYSPNGVYMGNKRYRGEDVVTKLHEDYFKGLKTKIQNFNYWIATSYSLPTDSIVNFFNKRFKAKTSEDDSRIRPVLAPYILIPASILIIISCFFRFFNKFTLNIILVLLSYNTWSDIGEDRVEKKEKSSEIIQLESEFQNNDLDLDGKSFLANQYLKEDFNRESEILFSEILSEDISKDTVLDQVNYAASMAKNNKIIEALNKYSAILDFLENHEVVDKEKITNLVKENIQKLIYQKKQEEKQKKDEEKKEEEEKKEDQKNNKGGSGKPNDKDEKEKSEEEKKKEENQSKDKDKENDKNSDEKKEQEVKPKESDERQKMPKQKMPSILKQLMSDDAQLQKKLIDTETTENKDRDEKDW